MDRSIVIITGASGLVGSETARHFASQGLEVVGIDNDLRATIFGPEASTAWSKERLKSTFARYTHEQLDIRDFGGLLAVFQRYGKDIGAVIHTAAQPSHDFAAKDPFLDFTVNANGTLHLLELTRRCCPDAAFVYTSTNKVYGDLPNALPLIEQETRYELSPDHRWAEFGVDESMSIDQNMHSLFGVSKTAGDLLVQEYARYFGLKTGVFRCGCITGGSHAGAELHGFLAYLAFCALKNTEYAIYGYKGKQVRDNIHATDLARAIGAFVEAPKPGKVYNMGGGRFSNCSVLEAIALCEDTLHTHMNIRHCEEARKGDHQWWISDYRAFAADYPDWSLHMGLHEIIHDVIEGAKRRIINS